MKDIDGYLPLVLLALFIAIVVVAIGKQSHPPVPKCTRHVVIHQ